MHIEEFINDAKYGTTSDKLYCILHTIQIEKMRGRPSKYYRRIAEYMHDNDYIHFIEGQSYYYTKHRLSEWFKLCEDAGQINNIFFNIFQPSTYLN